jgi:TonB family protein
MRSSLFLALLFAISSAAQEPAPVDNSVTAKLDATISSRGDLEGTVTVLASGSMRPVYRAAVPPYSYTIPSSDLFGRFLQIRPPEATPVLTNADVADHPMQIGFRIREEEFLLPIHRQHSVVIDLLPMTLAFLARPGRAPVPPLPDRFHEEISLEIPPDFTVRVGPPFREERAYALYRSEARVEAGRLLVVRELVIQKQATAALSEAERDGFGHIIRADQEKQLVLRRISRVHAGEFIRSVSPSQANHYGLIAQQQREYDAARELFLRAIEAQPESTVAWNNLGRALAAMGDLDGAQKAYEKQISINPRDRYSYNNLGLVQERQGRWDEAIVNLRKQIAINPGDSYATANLPRALIQAHRWAEAETAASRALEAHPGNAQHRLNLAIARVCQGKAADPRREIEDALGARPPAALLNNASYYLTECGKESELAESYIRKALDLALSAQEPLGGRTISSAIAHQITISTYLDTYGWLLFRQNNTERSVSLLSAAATLAPRAELFVHLAEAESKSGRTDLAVSHWREATFLEPGRRSQVPPEIAPKLTSTPPLSLDSSWYPLTSDSLAVIEDVGQPSYFFVMADPSGGVTSARELDAEDQPARRILPAVRAIPFPVVKIDGNPIPTVHLIRVQKESNGKVLAARSLGTEAVAIAGELAPAEFPSPAPANPEALTAAAGVNTSGITMPRILERIAPQYPEQARIAHLSGVVHLYCVVGSDGVARDFRETESLGLGLDESAVRAVSAWRFAPGLKDGKPVDVATTVDVNFQLANSPSQIPRWHVGRVWLGATPGATRPMISQIVAPRAAADAGIAAATITFDVDERGAAVHLQIKETTDEGWAKDVTAALSKWKFVPAQKNGNSIPIPATMDFVRGN